MVAHLLVRLLKNIDLMGNNTRRWQTLRFLETVAEASKMGVTFSGAIEKSGKGLKDIVFIYK